MSLMGGDLQSRRERERGEEDTEKLLSVLDRGCGSNGLSFGP